MIRRLTSKDLSTTMSFIKQHAAENLFIIGDIEAFGFDQSFQQLWGEFDDDNQLKAVLLRYYGNFIPYAPDEFSAAEFAKIIMTHPECHQVSGIKKVIDRLSPYFTSPVNSRELFYSKCDSTKLLDASLNLNHVKHATYEDIDRIVSLRASIPEFSQALSTADQLKRNMDQGVSRTFFIEEEGQMVSSASTTAENKLAAMVVAVCTREGSKKKGYATACVTKLCYELLSEGKELCLFYDNPEAGHIYKRLGFEDIDKWVMCTFTTK